MASFSEANLKKKLAELSSTQQSIQTLSLWLIHHRKHAAIYSKLWLCELKKTSKTRKLTYMYLANDVLQNGRKKAKELQESFSKVLPEAFKHAALEEPQVIGKLNRIISIWDERKIFDADVLQKLRTSLEKVEPVAKKRRIEEVKLALQEEMSKDSSDEANEEVIEADELSRLISSLANSASSDANVRQQIAGLPSEVSDPASLKKVKGKAEADRLGKEMESACKVLNDYNARLTQELNDRKKLSKALPVFITNQRDKLAESQQKLEEYKHKLAGVGAARIELEQHIKALPDLSQLKASEDALAPLPSAGDLFSL